MFTFRLYRLVVVFFMTFAVMRFDDSKHHYYSRGVSPFFNLLQQQQQQQQQQYGSPMSPAIDNDNNNNHNELIPFYVISNNGSATLVNDFRIEPDDDSHRRRRHRRKRVYSDWSDWSPCDSVRCTAVRQKHCVRRNVCGSNVVTESSYCYTEGSRCLRLATDYKRWPDDRSHSAADKVSAGASVQNFTCGTTSSASKTSAVTRRPRSVIKKIMGGRETEKFRWPWQVAVLNGLKELICGGTLVAPGWVLTAAHCTRKRLIVRLREYDLFVHEGDEIDARVERVVVHPKYNPDTVDNDMALLKLRARDLLRETGHLEPACLPVSDVRRFRRKQPTMCVVVGWGKVRSRDSYGSKVLQEARVPIVGQRTCRAAYRRHSITENMLCAGYRDGRSDTCSGDSGGPLLCRTRRGRWTVVGVTSFGDGCGRRGKYGIYASVANGVRWIAAAIRAT